MVLPRVFTNALRVMMYAAFTTSQVFIQVWGILRCHARMSLHRISPYTCLHYRYMPPHNFAFLSLFKFNAHFMTYSLNLPEVACGSVGSAFVSQPQGPEFESRSGFMRVGALTFFSSRSWDFGTIEKTVRDVGSQNRKYAYSNGGRRNCEDCVLRVFAFRHA